MGSAALQGDLRERQSTRLRPTCRRPSSPRCTGRSWTAQPSAPERRCSMLDADRACSVRSPPGAERRFPASMPPMSCSRSRASARRAGFARRRMENFLRGRQLRPRERLQFVSVRHRSGECASKQARRVAKPTGKVSMAVWGSSRMRQSAVVVKVIGPLLPRPRPALPVRSRCRSPARWSRCCRRPASNPGRWRKSTRRSISPTTKTPIAASHPGSGLRAIRAAGAEKLRAAMLAALAPFRTTSGSLHLANKFRFVARP